jgi:hypothetical protein
VETFLPNGLLLPLLMISGQVHLFSKINLKQARVNASEKGGTLTLSHSLYRS